LLVPWGVMVKRAHRAPGRPKVPFTFSSDEEIALLYEWSVHPPDDNPSLALRAKIVLACGKGYTNRYVAQHYGVGEGQVAQWRQRYVDGGIEALRDKPRTGAPPSISEEVVDAVIAATWEPPPAAALWTTRSMATAIGISASSVGRIWRQHGVDPRRRNIVPLSLDPDFVDRVRAVVGLFLDPPGGALVLVADQAVDVPSSVVHNPRGARWPRTEDRGSDQSEFHHALVVAAGRVLADPVAARTNERDRGFRFQQFLFRLDQLVPRDFDVHVIADQASNPRPGVLRDWLTRHLRLQLHVAPTDRWWMTLLEWWLTELGNRGLSLPPAALAASINDWTQVGREDPRPFLWLQSAAEIAEILAIERAPRSRSEETHGGAA
jgi:transposase